MNKKLLESEQESYNIAKQLVGDIFDISFHIFDTQDELVKFCEENRASDAQAWLEPEALLLILENIHRDKINYFEDILKLRIAIFYWNGRTVVLGPYLPEEIDVAHCIKLCSKMDKMNMDYRELLVYYGKYPVIPEQHMDRIMRGILRTFKMDHLEEHYTIYNGGESAKDPIMLLDEMSNSNIETHYMNERKYMDAIRKGNLREVLYYRELLSNDAARMWTADYNMEHMRLGFAVNRAMSRIAAYEAGVPAPLIHRITVKESIDIGSAQSVKQMTKACEEMLKEFCDLIRDINNNKYSAMVQSIMYSINQQYMNELTVSDMANELEVSESYMIKVFKKETDMTPSLYLRMVRMKHAANLLVSTDYEIQKIGGMVGINDANYFAKLFRSIYKCTPKDYRKRFRI